MSKSRLKPQTPGKYFVLTRRELDNLTGRNLRTTWIKRHQRVISQRTPEQIKNHTIETFARRFVGQAKRYGLSADDERHITRLIAVLAQVPR